MIVKKIIIAIFSVSVLINCTVKKMESSEQNEDKTATIDYVKNEDQLVYLKEGEMKFLKEQQMNVTFKGITADSRCPEGVNCVWSGAATASIEIMTTTSRFVKIELSSIDNSSMNLIKSKNVADYSITLEKVLPYPNQTINKADLKGNYKIALKIEKLK